MEVAGDDRIDSVEMLVLGESIAVMLSLSNGRIETPSSRVVEEDRMGLKVLFLLLAK